MEGMMGDHSLRYFESNQAVIGTFYCPVTDPIFSHAGHIDGYTIVFPRTSVTITQHGRAPVVADPNVIMFYNKGQGYRRGKVSEQGDLCDWFGFGRTAVIEAVRSFDPAVDNRWPEPFCFGHGPSDSDIYLQQRLLIRYLNEINSPDLFYVEEKALGILHEAVADAYQARQMQQLYQSKTHQTHEELVQAVKEVLALRFKDSLSLAQIATAVYSSPYHLSRIFRKLTGFTIHTYLNQLRLRTALNYVAQTDTNLTDLGLELGYSSHSHFTQAFRRAFGKTPSAFRESANTRQLQNLRKILIA
jgi:AraC family transcriptional regulator